MTKYALTSISPKHVISHVQPTAIKSWIKAGFKAISFNAPYEIEVLKDAFPDVEFIPCYRTMDGVFKAPYVPISAFIDYAKEHDLNQVMLINSDIVLRDEANAFDKYWEWAVNGLVISNRQDHDGSFIKGTKYLFGFDVFIINNIHYGIIPQSMFCMGQTWWDYWVPYRFIKSNIQVREITEGLFFHQIHDIQYDNSEWVKMTEYFRWAEQFNPAAHQSRHYRQPTPQQLTTQVYNTIRQNLI